VSGTGKNWYLVCYDVRDPKRLRKTAKLLEGYGERIQYSVFRVRLTEHKLQKVRWELSEILLDIDDLVIIPLCTRCSSKIDELSLSDQSSWDGDPSTFEVL